MAEQRRERDERAEPGREAVEDAGAVLGGTVVHGAQALVEPDLAGWRRERPPEPATDAVIRVSPDRVCGGSGEPELVEEREQ